MLNIGKYNPFASLTSYSLSCVCGLLDKTEIHFSGINALICDAKTNASHMKQTGPTGMKTNDTVVSKTLGKLVLMVWHECFGFFSQNFYSKHLN